MNEDLIERLAREAGFDTGEYARGLSGNSEFDRIAYAGEYPVGESLAIFAALVAEECAKVCETPTVEQLTLAPHQRGSLACAAAIRAKFRTP